MSRRNRKRHVEGFALPVPFAGLVILAVTFSLGYVWLTCRCEGLGRDIAVLEKQKAELAKQFSHEEFKWSRMRSPIEIEKALARCNLEMVLPDHRQVVRISAADLPPAHYEEEDQPEYAMIERTLMNE